MLAPDAAQAGSGGERATQDKTRNVQAGPGPALCAGAFPADATEALPIYGPIQLSDASAVSGQIPGIPSPSLPGRAAAPGRGPGFSRAGGFLGAESPRPGSRAPAAEPWEPPERLSTGWRLSPAAPTPPPLDRPWRGATAASPLLKTPSGQLPPGRAAPARQCPPPVCQARSRRRPGLVLSGQLFGQLGVAAARSPAAEVEVQFKAASCRWGKGAWKLEDPSAERTTRVKPRISSVVKGMGLKLVEAT